MSEIVERIRENCDIVDIVGKYVELRRFGSNYKGLCPFHSEKTPSFVVSQQKQIFTCFGCGKTGDVITFVQEIEGLSFMEALEKLGDIVGIEVKHASSDENNKKKDALYNVSRLAAVHFYKNLRNGSNDGLKYVVSRGISPQTAQKFGIGYAAAGWQDLYDFFKQKNISENLGLEAGLFVKNDKNRVYDKFRNRVVFPIKNTRGKIIGFGARAIDGADPKYLNSPETAIFKKKDNLYGLNLARNEIRKKNQAIMVEGYMDVVSLVDAGIENVVASLGTAMTIEQARLLKRYADTVVLAYDSDSAGQNATLRGIDLLLSAGCKVKILQLDDGKDPDEYVKKHGKKEFENLIDKAISYMEYKIARIKGRCDMSTTEGSIQFLEEASLELSKVASPAQQAAYVKMVAEISSIPESSIQREIERISRGSKRKTPAIARESVPKPENEEAQTKTVPIEKYKVPVVKTLIKLMLENSQYVKIIAQNDKLADYFYGSGYEKIWEQIVMNNVDDSEIDINLISDSLSEEDYYMFNDIVNNFLPVLEEGETLVQCAERIKLQELKKRQREIISVINILDENENKGEMQKLSEELMDIANSIKKIKEGKE